MTKKVVGRITLEEINEIQSLFERRNGLNDRAPIHIPNPQLLKLDHAPLCRICDAYQCKRCVWLNQKLTLDINTPSHQQCVLAHLERNASRELQQQLTVAGFTTGEEVKEITYIDPFDVREQF